MTAAENLHKQKNVMKKGKEIQSVVTSPTKTKSVLQTGVAPPAAITTREENTEKTELAADREMIEIVRATIVDPGPRAPPGAETETRNHRVATQKQKRKCTPTFRKSPATLTITTYFGTVFNGSISKITCRLNPLTTNRILICSRLMVARQTPQTRACSRTSRRGSPPSSQRRSSSRV